MKRHSRTLNFLIDILKTSDVARSARPHRHNQRERRLRVSLQTETLQDRRLMTATINRDPALPIYTAPGSAASPMFGKSSGFNLS